MSAFSVTTYIDRDSSVHSLDARSKIFLLLIYSISLFFIETWLGMIVMAAIFLIVLVMSHIPARSVFLLVVPVYFIAALTVVFNSFTFAPQAIIDPQYLPFATVSDPFQIAGNFCFVPAGCARGCFFAMRILLLVWASLIVCFTSTSSQLTCALNAFLKPLRRFHVPTDDIAMVFSIALRFIPLVAEEFMTIRKAQWSRGAAFESGPARERIKAHVVILVPLFVGMFRKADNLARAMDARCYGMPGVRRTSLSEKKLDARSASVLVLGTILVVLVAVFL